MFKKNVLGLTILAAGFLLWSCGDGSIDPLSDSEIMMISRFPSTIDYDMLDSIVKACEKDEACWEKAKKTGEIYKGDYTKVLRDSSGNIVVVEGDSAYTWKDGKKLPVFNFSSNSNDDDDDDVTSSGSTATSGSSSKESSASGFEKDERSGYGDNPDSAGSGAGGKSRNHAEESSSSRNGSGNSSSIDASQYTNPSSSSRGTYTGSMSSHSRSSSSKNSSSSVDLSFLSSSSIPTVSMSSIAVVESSSSKQQLSAGSESSQGGGGSISSSKKCGDTPVSGICKSDLKEVYPYSVVTYTYKPNAGSCTIDDENIEWRTNDTDASVVDSADGVRAQDGGFTFKLMFGQPGIKTQTVFSMDENNILCDEDGETVNVITCPETHCSCTLDIGVDKVDLASAAPKDTTFTWNTSCCSVNGRVTFNHSWSLNGASSSGVSLVKKLKVPGTYQPTLSISTSAGESFSSTCDAIQIVDKNVPKEISTLGTTIEVEDGDKVKVVGDALSSGSQLRCYHAWQNSSCTIQMVGATTTSNTIGNCNSSSTYNYASIGISQLSNGIAIVNLTGVASVTCSVH